MANIFAYLKSAFCGKIWAKIGEPFFRYERVKLLFEVFIHDCTSEYSDQLSFKNSTFIRAADQMTGFYCQMLTYYMCTVHTNKQLCNFSIGYH